MVSPQLERAQTYLRLGIGCGTIGRVDALDARDPRFKSSHRQCTIYFLSTVFENMNIKKKEANNGPILKVFSRLLNDIARIPMIASLK